MRDLLAKLQEAERQQQSDRVAFEVSREMPGDAGRCGRDEPRGFPGEDLSSCRPRAIAYLSARPSPACLSEASPWFRGRLPLLRAAEGQRELVWQSGSRQRHLTEFHGEELGAPGTAWAGPALQVAWHSARRADRTRG